MVSAVDVDGVWLLLVAKSKLDQHVWVSLQCRCSPTDGSPIQEDVVAGHVLHP